MSRASLAKFAMITSTWHAGAMTISPPATRRARQRQATVAEIKALARAQLAADGADAVNLRAIARQMGTTSSALFRYFPSHADLISALLADAYAALAEALAAAVEARPPPAPSRPRSAPTPPPSRPGRPTLRAPPSLPTWKPGRYGKPSWEARRR